MRIIRGIRNLKIATPTAVTVGIFDGVHRGHRKILRELKKYSKAINGKSCVVTFEPHPLKVLNPHKTPPMLISPEHKMRLLEASGVDMVVVINFTNDFADITPEQFAEDVLVRKLHVKEFLVGENFVLGKGRSGDAGHLKRLGQKFAFKVRVIKPLKVGNNIVSSTLIRKLIMSGEIVKARQLLGRDVSILGTVVRGLRIGRTIGFPTANINPHHEAIPPGGVYIVKAKLGDKQYHGVVNIGFRPTFKTDEIEPTVETHIFGLNTSIYGKDIEVVFLKRIRREYKFKNKERLLERIEEDVEIAKKYFNKRRKR